jgi:hypothetical protein
MGILMRRKGDGWRTGWLAVQDSRTIARCKKELERF